MGVKDRPTRNILDRIKELKRLQEKVGVHSAEGLEAQRELNVLQVEMERRIMPRRKP